MPVIRTVLGDIDPAAMGPTLSHEHLSIDLKRIFQEPADPRDRAMAHKPVTLETLGWVQTHYAFSLDNLGLYDEALVIEEARRFHAAGGRTIVEATPADTGRDPAALARIARGTGLNVVMGSGYYVSATHPPDLAGRSEADIAAELVRDITEGVGGTGIKAGVIGELGSVWPMHPSERKVLRGGARAQAATGAAITIHPGRDPAAPAEILREIADAGGDPRRTVIGHLERTFHRYAEFKGLAETGCYLEIDLFGLESAYYPFGKMDLPNDGRRIDLIKRLVEDGHAGQILISHDIAFKHTLVRYGGRGYAHILENVVPKMRDKGLAERDIAAFLIDNPRRAFALP